jgi:hypothetical protein
MVVSNASPRPMPFEADFNPGDLSWTSATSTGRRNGRPLWRVTVPANGRASITYRLDRPR